MRQDVLRSIGRAAMWMAAFSVPACGSASQESQRADPLSGEGESALCGGPGTSGALIRVSMKSTVGLLLDEIPAGPLREAAAAEALAQSASFWQSRAARQTKLTYYRLMWREFYYSQPKGPLPLPARVEPSMIALQGAAHRSTKKGHDAIVFDYVFQTHLLSDAASPALAEPELANVGGAWNEHFSLPLDPDLLFERTGYACMDEAEYPPGSVFEENTYHFFDDTCGPETPNTSACHVTQFPLLSCVDALKAKTGLEKTKVRFERVACDPVIAASVRTGTVTSATTPDLSVVEEDMEEEQRVYYRYFEPGSCEEQEGVIAQPGWRRLLTFSASVQNDGALPIHVGDVTDPTSPWLQSHAYELSACHGHYHFSHYGNFDYDGAPGAKRAFCLLDSNRYHNNENTSLIPDYHTCHYQGITPGWGDEYQFGIPGQWVDITGVDTSAPRDLTFEINPDKFLCEGAPSLDQNGSPIFDPTPFFDEQGNPVTRQRCSSFAGWDDNNRGVVEVAPKAGSFVTEPCDRGQVGPLRSCGFDSVAPLYTCAPGSQVTLQCTTAGPAQVLRVCERSEVLGTGVACAVGDASANVVVGNAPTQVSFACPAVRDAAGTGGYSVYHAPVLPSQALAAVTCTGG